MNDIIIKQEIYNNFTELMKISSKIINRLSDCMQRDYNDPLIYFGTPEDQIDFKNFIEIYNKINEKL